MFIAMLLLAIPVSASAEPLKTNIPPPAQGSFVQDTVGLIGDPDVAAIEQVATESNNQRHIPIYVLTVTSVHDSSYDDIDTFAQAVYDDWGIGSPTLNGQPWNRGALIVVAFNDHVSRIQLGSGFDAALDPQVAIVMQNMTELLKKADFSKAIRTGSEQLASVVAGQPVTATPTKSSASYVPMIIGALIIVLLIGLGISLIRSGRKGLGWTIIGGVVGTLALVLLLGSKKKSSGLGGGTSHGGGGATGSW